MGDTDLYDQLAPCKYGFVGLQSYRQTKYLRAYNINFRYFWIRFVFVAYSLNVRIYARKGEYVKKCTREHLLVTAINIEQSHISPVHFKAPTSNSSVEGYESETESTICGAYDNVIISTFW